MDLNLETLRQDGRINLDRGLETGIINFNEYELRGARNKFWFNNYGFLYKEIFENSYEDYGELIASEIADLFGINHATYDLATYNNKNGVITKNFVNEDQGEELISGTEIIFEVYNFYILPLKKACMEFQELINGCIFCDLTISEKENLLKKIDRICEKYNLKLQKIEDLNDLNNNINPLDELLKNYVELFDNINSLYDFTLEKDQHDELKINNLFDLWSILDIYMRLNNFSHQDSANIISQLADLFMYDIITLQGDRHTGNWGLIVNKSKKEIKLSPIFDNSNIFNLNRSKVLDSIVSKLQQLENKNLQDLKKARLYERLKKEIYHPKSLLRPDQNRLDNLDQIKTFLGLSTIDFKEKFYEKINLLTDNLDLIFERIESKIKQKIPDNIKYVVLETIKINQEELENLKEKGMVN